MSQLILQHLAGTDKRLAKLIRSVGPCLLGERLPKRHRRLAAFEALVESVVYQQLTGKVAGTIFRRVLACFPGKRFPTPEELRAIDDATLWAAGLSGAKTAALKDIAARALDGTIPFTREILKLTDEEIVERLTVIRGVGPWTAQMVLMFTLGRPDIWPTTDYGVRKGFATVYGLKDLPSPKELARRGEKWRPYRSTVAWYLWRAASIEVEL